MKLFHGSCTNITDGILRAQEPFSKYGYTKRVCFSRDENAALLYSINPIKAYKEITHTEGIVHAFSVHIDFQHKPFKVYELYDGMFEELFNRPCYIYECDVDDSIVNDANNGFEKYVEKDVYINRKITIDNYLQELKEKQNDNCVELVYFNENTVNILYDSLECKAVSVESIVERDFIEKKCCAFNINVEKCREAFYYELLSTKT